MSSKLISFLNHFKVKKKDKKDDTPVYTHTSMGKPPGSYNIPMTDRPELHRLIAHSVFELNKPVHLTEKSYQVKPITIDLDFQYPADYSTRQHTEDHIRALVELYNETIRMYVGLPEKTDLEAFVLERDSPYPYKGNYKDGIHIIYPNIAVDVAIQHLIRNRVVRYCSKVFESNKFGRLPLKNHPDNIIDEAVISKNNWTMYGCSKPGKTRYELTHVYHSKFNDFDGEYQTVDRDIDEIQEEYSNLHLIGFLSLHKDLTDITYQINSKHEDELEKIKEGLLNKKSKSSQNKTRNNFKNRKLTIPNTKENLKKKEEAIELLKLLQPWRSFERKYWIEVGWCLKSIHPGLLDAWIEFSRQWPKFDEEKNVRECEEEWERAEDRGLGMGSLHRWARLDNPNEYKRIRSEFISNYIHRSISGTTQDVAVVVYQLFKHRFVCVSARQNIWYEFRNHRWSKGDAGIMLKKRISNEVLNEYLELISHYNITAIHEVNDNKEQHLFRAKAMTDVTYKLRDYNFKEKVMKECMVMFHDRDFLNDLDEQPYLIGFDNGVYDLENDEFRDGRPEDRLSLTTGNDYIDEEMDEDNEIVIEIREFMRQVFPHPERRKYVWYLLSSFLQGINPDEKFHIFTGVGGNGKSKLQEIFEKAFGEYTFKFPITMLTQKRTASSAAQPELARTKGKRAGSFQEPDEGERINVGLMKELTGGDKIVTRALYSEPIEFKPQFKLILCCNKLPKVPPDDEGTWRRLRVIDFVSRFVSNPSSDKSKYEFPRDEYLSQKIERWVGMFMVMLIHYYKKYRAEGLVEPDCVMEATYKYRKEGDLYTQFKEDYFVKDTTDSVKLEKAHNMFKQWYQKNIGEKPPKRREFKAVMERKLNQSYTARKGWVGWRLKTLDEMEGLVPAVSEGFGKEPEPEPEPAYVESPPPVTPASRKFKPKAKLSLGRNNTSLKKKLSTPEPPPPPEPVSPTHIHASMSVQTPVPETDLIPEVDMEKEFVGSKPKPRRTRKIIRPVLKKKTLIAKK